MLDLADGKPADPEAGASVGQKPGPASAPSTWTVAALRDGGAEDPTWVFRRIAVTVRVAEISGQVAIPLGKVQLTYTIDTGPETPWTDTWLVRHGIRTSNEVSATAGPDSTLVVDVPRIRGLRIGASCPGFAPGTAKVDVTARPLHAEAAIALSRPVVVSGHVCDDEGKPLAQTQVYVYVERRMRPDEVNVAELQAAGHGVSIRSSADEAVVTLVERVVTDTKGNFAASLSRGGDTMLWVWPDGHGAASQDLGVVGATRSDVRVVVPRTTAPRYVKILRDGTALANARVLFAELDARVGQPSPGPVVLDASGRARTEWLVSGHRYFVQLWSLPDAPDAPSRGGTIVWNDQSEIDIARDLAVFK